MSQILIDSLTNLDRKFNFCCKFDIL